LIPTAVTGRNLKILNLLTPNVKHVEILHTANIRAISKLNQSKLKLTLNLSNVKHVQKVIILNILAVRPKKTYLTLF